MEDGIEVDKDTAFFINIHSILHGSNMYVPRNAVSFYRFVLILMNGATEDRMDVKDTAFLLNIHSILYGSTAVGWVCSSAIIGQFCSHKFAQFLFYSFDSDEQRMMELILRILNSYSTCILSSISLLGLGWVGSSAISVSFYLLYRSVPLVRRTQNTQPSEQINRAIRL